MVRFLKTDGQTIAKTLSLPARSRRTLTVGTVPGMEKAEFSTVVESGGPIVVDRTMTWDAGGYGTHAETSIASAALAWYLADGGTGSGLDLFFLIQNPNATAAAVLVTYLLPAPRLPVIRTYTVAPNSRFNIWVNQEGAALAGTDLAAVVTSTNGVPIIVERAVYLNAQGQTFGAGHESAAVTTTAPSWFLAEGATGSFFDLFIAIANPNAQDASVTTTFLLPTGTTIAKTYTVAANSRFTIAVDQVDARLADTAVSTTVASTNGVPIVVERTMWWPGPTAASCHETHNSPGSTATGTTWALADGEVGGPRSVETYLLLANTSTTPGSARVTLLFEDGTTAERTFALNPSSRFNVSVAHECPGAAGKRFGAIIESLGSPAAQIAVERAMYSNAAGVFWAAGTNALGSRLQ